MIDIIPVLGVPAAAVGVADTIPYVRDILRGSTRPHRGTWLIWGVLAFVVCLSQRADGASWSLVMAATQVVLTTGIAVGVLDVSLLLYPIYCCLVNGAIALLIARRRYALRPALAVVRPFPARVHGQELL